jgi:catechol 2,3-dioxygenase-like lactoylglutathione lyase family enzyme
VITHTFAGLAVGELDVALGWYERLLGRGPDSRPHAGEAVWELTTGGLLYVVRDESRAGRGLITLIVDDLDEVLAGVAARGLRPGVVTTLGSGVRTAKLADPEGNLVTFGELPGGRAPA